MSEQRPGAWHVLGEKPVWAGVSLGGAVAAVASPTGGRVDVEVVRSRFNEVSCLVYNHVGEVLLVQRHRFALDCWGWELPTCEVAPNSDIADIEAAGVREVETSCRWSVHDARHVTSWALWPQRSDHVRHLVVAKATQQVGGHNPGEIASDAWVHRRNLSQVLGDVHDVTTFAAVLWWAYDG